MATSEQSASGPAPLAKRSPLSLFKGKRIKGELKVDLKWDMLVADAEEDYDLDLSAFMVTKAGTVPNGNSLYCVYYNSEQSADHAAWHHASVQEPGEDTDDEIIYVHLHEVNDNVDKIMLVVSIYEGEALGHTFDKMSKATVTISGEIVSGKDELVTIGTDTIAGRYEGMTAVVVGEIHRVPQSEDAWEYRRIDRAYKNLVDVGKLYGVEFR